MEQIYSSDNKTYKLIKKLSKKKYRDENNIFIAEGEKFLKEDKNYSKVVVSESCYEYYESKYSISSYENLVILNDKLFKEISTQEHSQGIIFIYNIKASKISNIKGDIVILDDVQDPGNAGTIIRSLVALGYTNLILTKGSVDVYAPKVVRSSMGAIFKINILYETVENILDFLEKNEYMLSATALSEDSINYSNLKLKKDKNAYVFGHEGGGVRKEFLTKSNKYIIPMTKGTNSLNVAISLSVFLYKARELENFFCVSVKKRV